MPLIDVSPIEMDDYRCPAVNSKHRGKRCPAEMVVNGIAADETVEKQHHQRTAEHEVQCLEYHVSPYDILAALRHVVGYLEYVLHKKFARQNAEGYRQTYAYKIYPPHPSEMVEAEG